MEAVDKAYSLFEMADGAHRALPCRADLPSGCCRAPGMAVCKFMGTEGNLLFGSGYNCLDHFQAQELLPHIDADGWYHIPPRGDGSKGKWPQPTRAPLIIPPVDTGT